MCKDSVLLNGMCLIKFRVETVCVPGCPMHGLCLYISMLVDSRELYFLC